MQAITAAIEGSLKGAFNNSPWLFMFVFAFSSGGFGTAINALIPIRADAHTATMDREIMKQHVEWEEEHFAPLWQTEQRLLNAERDCESVDERIDAIERWKEDHREFRREAELNWNLKFQSFESRLEYLEDRSQR